MATISLTKIAKNNRFLSLIRPRVFLAVLVLSTAIGITGHFYLDSYIKESLEHYSSLVNGAPVSIGSLKTNLLTGKVYLKDIEVTHHTQQTRNLLEISELNANFSWISLLSGKLVIPEITVQGLQIFNPRSQSGTLQILDSQPLPPSLVDRVITGIYEPLRKEIGDTPLRKLALLSSGLGTDSRVSQLKTQMGTPRRLAELRKQIEFQSKAWEKAAIVFQLGPWVSAAEKTINESKDPRTISSTAPTLDYFLKELYEERLKSADTYKEIETESEQLKSDIAKIDNELKTDAALVRTSFGLPTLDGSDFTPALLGPKLLGFLERAGYWVDVSRRRMPITGQDHGGILVAVHPIDKGHEVVFGKKSTYPKILVKHIKIKSTSSQNPHSGDVQGEIRNFTTDPFIWREPLTLHIDADFPHVPVTNMKISAIIDHTQPEPNEQFKLSIDCFPLNDWQLENTPDLRLKVKTADAKLLFEGIFKGKEVLTQWSILASKVQYGIDTHYRLMQESLEEVFVPLSTLYASGTIKGEGDKLDLDITSNVGKRLGSVLTERFKNSLEAVNDTLKQELQEQFGPLRRQIQDILSDSIDKIRTRHQVHDEKLSSLEIGLKALQKKTKGRVAPS